MQTSRFQLGLIATLSVGLGFSLSSSDAVGYPAGAAVSMGTNPLWAKGGTLSGSGAPVTVLTAPPDRLVVVTDLLLTYQNSNCDPILQFRTGGGEQLASFQFFHDADSDKTMQPTLIQHSFGSGLPVPLGETMELQDYEGCGVSYTISGYFAQP